MKGRIFLFLFALPFFLVGVWMCWSIGNTLVDAQAMQHWVPVQATIHRAGYDSHTGDDSTTYEVYAEYAYQWQGLTYHSRRVSISGGADNVGDYHRDTAQRLTQAQARGDTVTVYVDPERPENAVIDRRIRWGLLGFKSIFLFAFGGVGLGLMIFTVRAPREKDQSEPRYVDRPWLTNDAWQTPSVRSDSRGTMWFTIGFAALWNLISAPLPFLIYEEAVLGDNRLAWIGLLFPAVGLGLLWWAVSRVREWRSFGPTPLQMDPWPGAIGGHVGGTIKLKTRSDSTARYALTLNCLKSYMSGSGDSRSRREKPLWQDQQVARAERDLHGTRLSFRFDVPEGLEEADADRSESTYHLWRLELHAELDGVDLDRSYDIPVYRTGATSKNLSATSMAKGRTEQRSVNLDRIRGLVKISTGVAGKMIHFPMGRYLWNGLIGALVGGGFAVTGYFLIADAGERFIGGVFGFLGTLVALGSLYAFLNSLSVSNNGLTIATTRRILGVPIRRNSMPTRDFVRFRKETGSSIQSGRKHVVLYKVLAVDRTGGELLIGEGFTGAGQADAAIQFFTQEFGLQQSRSSDRSAPDFVDTNLLTAD